MHCPDSACVVVRTTVTSARAVGTVEERVARVETEVIGLDRRLGRLEDAVRDLRTDVTEFRSALESKMDRQFHWLVGLMFSALVAVVIALVRR
jgi:predicted nuclease with TOPRIM domain